VTRLVERQSPLPERGRVAARLFTFGLASCALLSLVPRATSATPPSNPALPSPALSASASARVAPAASAASAHAAHLATTMNQIATRLAADVGSGTKQAVVCTAPLRSDEPAPRGAELAAKLASLLAGQLASSVARPEPVAIAAAQAVARRASFLVYLQTEIASGQLRVTADVYRASDNVWERAREPVPAPTVHAYAAGRIDGEVRAYLAPVPLVGARIDRATLEEKEVVALGCGDVDDDGSLEIVTLSRRRVVIGRARGGHFVIRHSAALRDLSGIAPTPLREPLGGIAIVAARRAGPYLDIGLSDRARGARLDGELHLLGAIQGVPFATPYGDACLHFQGSTLATTVSACTETDTAATGFDGNGPLDAVATGVFVSARGILGAVDAARDPRTGDVTLRSADRSATLSRAGAQIALADLDQDGAPEVISSLDVLIKPGGGADDALVITTWEASGSLRERSRTDVPTGIRALAACPPEGGGSGAVVLATAGELWIVR
jgi:hypothetical protein